MLEIHIEISIFMFLTLCVQLHYLQNVSVSRIFHCPKYTRNRDVSQEIEIAAAEAL